MVQGSKCDNFITLRCGVKIVSKTEGETMIKARLHQKVCATCKDVNIKIIQTQNVTHNIKDFERNILIKKNFHA
jgi:hypothetical protein